ncbi:hypothetical protein G7068_03310 [Leucobacter viscericola]|uniref:DUF7210 domain-containing protein n=1 Tax=Leucobacter viscericola TaxID=2714935 RepID=A0A6G7XCQ8_9MICO|nr:hypothetical protein [Leucobacter viscericola]QIK62343.1 hypothetical protein G7068_03310 [Leucobacter viscericola]
MATKVVIANGWTDPSGKDHKAGASVEVDPGTARDLIARGKARKADPEQKQSTADPKPETPKPASVVKESKNG